ncbi:MAG: IS3 family transposase [Actinomycetota bacterium]
MTFAFIDAEKANYPITLLCRTLGVSESGFFDWRARPPSARSQANAALVETIREIRAMSRGTYGSPRVWAELCLGAGIRVGRKRVERLMRLHGLEGVYRRRRRGCTRRDPTATPAEDLVNRQFVAERDLADRLRSLPRQLNRALTELRRLRCRHPDSSPRWSLPPQLRCPKNRGILRSPLDCVGPQICGSEVTLSHLLSTVPNMSYEHLGLKRWPFPVVPQPEYCKFVADRKKLRDDIQVLLRAFSRQDSSSIHLLWSWFGAGKTHTLYYLANQCGQTRDSTLVARLHAIYSEFPKAPRSFVDVYRAFATGLDIEELVDAYLEITTSPGAATFQQTLMTSSPDLGLALHVLLTGEPVDRTTAMRWLWGEALPAAQLRSIGISQKIASAEEASRILVALVRLLALAAESQGRPGCRVIWLLDEFQRIGQLQPRIRSDINVGLHSTFNACPSGFSIILSFSGKPEKELPDWFTSELRDRIGRTKVMVLPPLGADEALEFMRDVLKEFRTLEAYDKPPFFPFDEPTCRYIIDEVARTEDLKPRSLMHAFNAVLQEADLPLQEGSLDSISVDFARPVLAEHVSLAEREDGT